MFSLQNLLRDASWRAQLQSQFEQDYWLTLESFLATEYASKTIYPQPAQIFNAFHCTALHHVNVVILGQDPYHGGQAHGLSFSVAAGTTLPPSLKNIYTAIERQVGHCTHASGDLQAWAKQGVLLLNTVLTVAQGQAGSHRRKGWETFTDHVLQVLNAQPRPIVFLLWGNDAKSKGSLIEQDRHCVLASVHPSPLSARRGFFDHQHFVKVNTFLAAHNLPTVVF